MVRGLFLLIAMLHLGCGVAKAGELPDINFDKIVFLSSWTKSGKVQLVKGEYREPAAPGSATETVVKLAENIACGKVDGKETAAAILVTDPAQTFEFESLFDGLPPSLGTAFTPTAGSDEVLDVYLTDANGNLVELVGTSRDRRVITIPEPGSLTLLSVVALFGFWRARQF